MATRRNSRKQAQQPTKPKARPSPVAVDPSLPLPRQPHEDVVQLIFKGIPQGQAWRAVYGGSRSDSSAAPKVSQFLKRPAVAARLTWLRSQVAQAAIDEAVLTEKCVLRWLRDVIETPATLVQQAAMLHTLALADELGDTKPTDPIAIPEELRKVLRLVNQVRPSDAGLISGMPSKMDAVKAAIAVLGADKAAMAQAKAQEASTDNLAQLVAFVRARQDT